MKLIHAACGFAKAMRPGFAKPQAVQLVLLALIASPAFATDHLVTSGKDLKKILKTVQPGDVIVMKEGEWKDVELNFYATGEAGKPITLRAQTPGKVRLIGESSLRVGGSHLVVDGLTFTEGFVKGHALVLRGEHDQGASNCRITNCAFINYNPAAKPEKKENSQWLSLWGENNEVDHCYFKGKTTNGPMLVVWVEASPNNHHIHHNFFAGRPPLGENGGETIRVGTSDVSLNVSRTLVENNYFEHCDGEAEIISNKSCDNIYRYNTFVECKGAVVFRHGHRNTVEANWFFGNNVEGTGGVRIINEDQKVINNYFDSLAGKEFESALPIVNGIPNSKLNEYFRVKRALVAFNTFVNCRQNITFGIGVGARNRIEPPMDMTFANNVVVTTFSPIVKLQDQPIGTKWIGNVFFGADAGIRDSGVKVSDPKLMQDDAKLWRPVPASPLIGAAEGEFTSVTDDIEGRPREGKKDVGCFQQGGKATRRPLRAKDVGPEWMKD